MNFYLFAFFSALIFSWLANFVLIHLLKVFKAGQYVRAEGPVSHQKKTGTPTMGGLGFIFVTIVLMLVFLDLDLLPEYLALLVLIFGYALVGLTDDLLKLVRKDNLGLSFWQKIISQLSLAALFLLFISAPIGINNYLYFFFFGLFIIVGTANATNLTDGLNGLLAGSSIIAFFFMAYIASQLGFNEAFLICLILAGSILGFLYFNFPRALAFMGDVGSLAIGAALAGLAIIMRQEWLLALIGGVFVLEALSVIIQVASYKVFKKRVFKMSPLHHHFELMGLPEWLVVVSFWVVGIVFGVVGVLYGKL